jgi:hypothetical protein
LTKKESAIFSAYPADRRFRKFISKTSLPRLRFWSKENEAAEKSSDSKRHALLTKGY